MTKLTKEGLKENLDTISQFICVKCLGEWYGYCKKNRNGRQDLEQVSILISSILGGYRVMIGKQELDNMLVVFANMLADVEHKMEENEME